MTMADCILASQTQARADPSEPGIDVCVRKLDSGCMMERDVCIMLKQQLNGKPD